ncbi:cytochrome b/b6 domain-containing protein [Thiobacter aerophilum]|uniref:Cytochrome b/b6 domain-containing protein n=1 Tax=Thiobacter aerophilum TaxID=3121275 RepID=A0ABV0EBW6_9BURK
MIKTILVWDAPVRIGHWLMVVAFALAWATGESEQWRLIHAGAGGALVGVVAFRLLWGVIGSRHARFADFVRPPAAALAYLARLLHGQAPHYTGHNPAGAWAILLLLALGLATGASGWLAYNDFGGHLIGTLHEALADGMLTVVGAHVAGVILGSVVHRENLVKAMITGKKLGKPDEAIASAQAWAVPLLAASALAAAWFLSR